MIINLALGALIAIGAYSTIDIVTIPVCLIVLAIALIHGTTIGMLTAIICGLAAGFGYSIFKRGCLPITAIQRMREEKENNENIEPRK